MALRERYQHADAANPLTLLRVRNERPYGGPA
jgi:hypothetical protein